MGQTEEVTISEGDGYKLKVNSDSYEFFWKLKGDWFLLFRFERDEATGWAIPSTREVTLQLCTEVYQVPDFIPIRDKYVKISRQTDDSKIDFFYTEGKYVFKLFQKGKPVETKEDLDWEEFFNRVNKMCNVGLTPAELPNK